MATRAKTGCREAGCPRLVAEPGRCAQHTKAQRSADDKRRGSSTQRGYGSRWQRYRAWRLQQPEYTLCVMCDAAGRITPATDVDHIVRVNGADDPLFWDRSNHQSLCHRCHSIKTAQEGRERGRGGRIATEGRR